MTWQPTEGNTLDSLLAVAGWSEEERAKNGTPWRKGDLAVYRGMGGMEVHGARHEVVAGVSAFTRVSGDRNIVVKNDMQLNFLSGNQQLAPHGGASDARDSLTVHGNMRAESGRNRLTLGTGRVDRKFHGPHLKIVGMEGIICGGIFNRTYTTSLMTVAGLKMGDVFGGAAMGSAMRVHLGTMLYRSVEYSHWDMATYLRSVTSCVEPVVGSEVPAATKWARRGDVGTKIAFTIMPLAGMLYGIVMLPYALFGLLMLGAGFLGLRRNKPAAPGPVKQRMRTRTVGGAEVSAKASEVIV